MKKNCKTCGSEFTPTRSDKQYCSESCAQKFRNKKYREKIKANEKPVFGVKKILKFYLT